MERKKIKVIIVRTEINIEPESTKFGTKKSIQSPVEIRISNQKHQKKR